MDKKGKLSHIIQDDDKLLWPDNVYQGPDDWMYISINQLNTAPAFTGGKDIGVAPYFIYRFKKK
ncbi:hypothetical protein D3C87_1725430 [compost metagenome]